MMNVPPNAIHSMPSFPMVPTVRVEPSAVGGKWTTIVVAGGFVMEFTSDSEAVARSVAVAGESVSAHRDMRLVCCRPTLAGGEYGRGYIGDTMGESAP